MRQSMSRVGRCIDNGPMEGYWGILKSEMYYLKKFTSQEELTKAIEDYIIFYNTKRCQLKLKCMTPMEYHSAAAAWKIPPCCATGWNSLNLIFFCFFVCLLDREHSISADGSFSIHINVFEQVNKSDTDCNSLNIWSAHINQPYILLVIQICLKRVSMTDFI